MLSSALFIKDTATTEIDTYSHTSSLLVALPISSLPELAALGIEMLEQPLPAGQDAALAEIDRLVPIGADESCHVAADVERLVGRYDVVNIKLDKTGGLTEAMRQIGRAHV